ncbi:hypothetical protein V6N13_026299 [Hibiscus sabdariffa]
MEARGSQTVTLFVQNIPTALHWSGLRQVFEAKYGGRSWAWRKANVGNLQQVSQVDRFKGGKSTFPGPDKYNDKGRATDNHKAQADASEGLNSGELDSQEGRNYKRIQGHIEEETLYKLSKCLVGIMATICNTSRVEERLHDWGLGELVVKNRGGRRFLIEIKDHELFKILEEQNWSYLKEVFAEIEPWTEAYHLPERITWIQVTGIPLHCWNETTFKRIADLWGTLLAMGENANQSFDCAKVTLLLSTRQRGNIDEVIEVEVGRESFLIRIEELGFHDHAVNPRNTGEKENLRRKYSLVSVESSSGASSESNRSNSPTSKERSTCLKEDEEVNDFCMGNIFMNYATLNYNNEDRFVGEDEIKGCSPKDNISEQRSRQKVVIENEIINLDEDMNMEGQTKETGPSWVT